MDNLVQHPPITPEAYINVLAETEATIAGIQPISKFRDGLNTLMENLGITGGVARARYMAVMLSAIKSKLALVSASVEKTRNSKDMLLLLEAIPAMQEAEHLDNVAACLEVLLIREVLALES